MITTAPATEERKKQTTFLIFHPTISVICRDREFYMSKQMWDEFSYMRCFFRDADSSLEHAEIRAPDDWSAFFGFLSTLKLPDDLVHEVCDRVAIMGMDPLGRVAGHLAVEVMRWAQRYAATSECVNVVNAGCWPARAYVPTLTFAPARGTTYEKTAARLSALREAVVSSVLPIGGDASIDMRNPDVIRRVWEGHDCSARARIVRGHLRVACGESDSASDIPDAGCRST